MYVHTNQTQQRAFFLYYIDFFECYFLKINANENKEGVEKYLISNKQHDS